MSISRRDFLRHGAAASWLGACRPSGARKPNFVFFLADDLGVTDLSCYGSTFHETPNLDRLASQGMRFTNAYAAGPVCSPTRASIMTGKYPARLGITNFIPGDHRLPHSALIAVRNELQLPLEEVTVATALKTEGYRTACIGKWHLGGGQFDADKHGFDFYATRGKRLDDGSWSGHPRLEGAPGEYMTDRFTKTALRFLRENRNNPFFLFFCYHNPHIPLESKPEHIAKYKVRAKPGAGQSNPVYAGMLQGMDESAGSVIDELDTLGIAGNTVVIFFSDNGGLTVPEGDCQIATSNAPYRAGKGHLYEGGVRDPLIVRWPGVVKAGSLCDATVTSTDFYPTIVEAAGVREDPGRPVDGLSLTPLLKQSGALRREAIYWHYPHYSNQTGKPSGAIRQGDLKLIEFFEDNHVELYNVKDDPGEQNDLAAKLPADARSLRENLDEWRKTVGAKMPALNPNYIEGREWEGLPWVANCGWRMSA